MQLYPELYQLQAVVSISKRMATALCMYLNKHFKTITISTRCPHRADHRDLGERAQTLRNAGIAANYPIKARTRWCLVLFPQLNWLATTCQDKVGPLQQQHSLVKSVRRLQCYLLWTDKATECQLSRCKLLSQIYSYFTLVWSCNHQLPSLCYSTPCALESQAEVIK